MIFLSDSGVDGCGCIIVGNGFQTYFVLLVYEGRMQHRKPSGGSSGLSVVSACVALRHGFVRCDNPCVDDGSEL